MGSSSEQVNTSLNSGFGSTKTYPASGRQEYLRLRHQSSDLTRRRPRFVGGLNGIDNWPAFLKNSLVEAEVAFKSLSLAQNVKDNAVAGVSRIVFKMRDRLLKICTNKINSLNGPNADLYDCVQKVHQTNFWHSVEKFLNALFKWIEAELLKILEEIDTEKKCWAVHDILDQAEDLLWGIYA